MSFTGPAPNINLNQANLVLTDSSKRIKTPAIEITQYDSTGVTIGKLNSSTLDIQGNVYMGSNTITADGSNLTSIFPSTGTFGGSDALVTSIQIDGTGKVQTISERSITFAHVAAAGATSGDTITLTNATTAIDATGNVETASFFIGNGHHLTHTTDIVSTAVGSATSIPTIVFDADGRISAVGSNAINTTLSGVVANGNNASNTIYLESNTIAMITDGRVGVANTAPAHDFAVGTAFRVDNSSGDIHGTYFHGDAANLTAVSDISVTTPFGDSANVAQITFDANGRISTISNVEIASKVTASTTNYVAYYTGDGQVVGGDSGLIFNPTNESLTVGGTVNVGGDITVTGNLNITGNTTVTQNLIIEDPTLAINAASNSQDLSIVFTKPYGNIAMGWAGDSSAYNGKLLFGYTSNNGVTPFIDIDTDRSIEAKFFGTVTATSFAGSGLDITALNASNLTTGTVALDRIPQLTNAKMPATIDVTNLIGGGAGISTLNASNVTTGTLNNARLPATIDVTNLIGGGAGISALNASNVTTGTLDNDRLPATIDVTNLIGGGTGISALNASNVTTGTLDNARLPATVSVTTLIGAGEGITSLNASNLSTGTVALDRIPQLTNAKLPSAISVTSLAGSGLGITAMNASNLSTGEVPLARIPQLTNAKLPSAISVTSLTGGGAGISALNASNVTTGTLNNSRLPATIDVTNLIGGGAGISDIEASNITTGTLDNDRLPATVSVTNLVGGGAGISALNASNVSSGTLDNARLPATIDVTALLGGGAGISALNASNLTTGTVSLDRIPQLTDAKMPDNITAVTFIGGGSGMSDLNASNLTTGTLDNARLPATVSVTNLVGGGAGISALNASNVSSGTLDNARLPSAISVTSLTGGGAGISAINASNVSTGTLNNARLPSVISQANVNASSSIGVATTAPEANLHVVGNAFVTTDLTLGSEAQFFFDESATSLYIDSSQSITGNALVVADTMYVKDNNVFVDGNVTATNIITDAIVLGAGTVSVQSISLDDVIAVNGTTTRAITVGDINSTGTVSANIKSFNITHPIVPNMRLIHACIETSRADNMYMGSVILVSGRAEIDLDEVNNMTSGTFVALHKNVRVFTTNESDWDAVKGKVDGSNLTIECQNGESSAKVSWLVAGTRTDVPDLVVERDA